MNENDAAETKNRERLKRALVALDKMQARIDQLEHDKREPLAIIGLGCRFPGGADNPELFWQLLHNSTDAIQEVPKDRWDVDFFYDPDPGSPGKITSRYGGFIREPYGFDPQFFGLSARETVSLDPQQRLLLEVGWEALEDAGLVPGRLLGTRTGVYIGISGVDYLMMNRDIEKIDAYMASGGVHSTASGRLSFFLGLQGPCISVDTACSSSLVAVHLACQGLRGRECDLALVGGVNLLLSPGFSITFSKARMLSPDGRCKAFDASADGFIRAEGCGMIVLKRLADALADGDNIRAVIKGSAINHDGRTSGLTVPNGPSQEKVIKMALDNAGVEPDQVSYLETHGTGTSLGDPIEVGALAGVFGKNRTRDNLLVLGAVKTNLGHLEAAAGIAGLIKTVLCLQHREIPPNLHFKEPNPHIPWAEIPVKVPTERIPWGIGEKVRTAGVSSFGFSGTNAHVILEEAPREPASPQVKKEKCPVRVLTLSAASDKALKDLAGRYEGYLHSHPDLDPGDMCYTANTGRTHFQYRLSASASSLEEFREKLTAFTRGREVEGLRQRRHEYRPQSPTAFLFTGQGAQYPGMGLKLYETQPLFRETMDKCNRVLLPYLEKPLLEVIYSAKASPDLDETGYTQPALFALEYSLATLWRSWGIEPSAVMGHSVGEYVAACTAGVFNLEDGLKLTAKRAALMQALPERGQMVSVRAAEKQVTALIDSYRQSVSLAAVNGPESIVLSGESRALEDICRELESKGFKTSRLKVSHAFHSPLMDAILEDFEGVAREVSYSPPKINIVSNITGQPIGDEIATPGYWVSHVRKPVRFAAGMETLREHGYEVFLEIGPHPVLLGMGRQCLPGERGLWLPSLRREQDDWRQMQDSLGELYVHGAAVDWRSFYRDYPGKRISLPTYPFQRQSYRHESTRPGEGIKPGLVSAHNRKPHPLIDQKIDSPFFQGVLFESCFTPDSPSFLKDHLIFGKYVVPGACYLSMILAGMELNASLEHGAILEDIIFSQAMVIPENRARIIQLMIGGTEEGMNSFKIMSTGAEKGGSWLEHASGRILAAPLPAAPSGSSPLKPQSFREIKDRCPAEIIVSEFYRSHQQRQVRLGPGYRWIQSLWKGEGESLCRLKVPAGIGDPDEYQLHPGLIDSCFGLLILILPIGDNETILPFRVERFRYYRRPYSSGLWAHASLRRESGPGGKLLGDIRLYEETGEPVAEYIGLEGRRVSRDIILKSLQQDFSNILYKIDWHREESEGIKIPAKPGRWLIFGHKEGVGHQLGGLIQDHGGQYILVYPGQSWDCSSQREYRIDPGQPQDFTRLFREVYRDDPGLDGIVYMWSLESGGYERAEKGTGQVEVEINQKLLEVQPRGAGSLLGSSETLLPFEPWKTPFAHGLPMPWAFLEKVSGRRRLIEEGAGSLSGMLSTVSGRRRHIEICAGVLHMVQALVRAGWKRPPRLWLVTWGGQHIESAPVPLRVEQSALWGLGRVLGQEHPELNPRLLDMEPSEGMVNEEEIFVELWRPGHEDQVALRRGSRYVPRLEPLKMKPGQGSGRVLTRKEATYLVTGGLGGLGLKVAGWLAEQGAGHLVLNGRGEPSAEALGKINEMEQAGVQVKVIRADVSDKEEVARLLEEIGSSMPALGGIIHAAGVIDDGVLVQQDWERFKRVMAPKVEGAWNLHHLTMAVPLDFFVCFSSVSSVLGFPGQGNYAAANAFMDALAHHRHSLGLAGLSINWGPWAGAGMVTKLENRDQQRTLDKGMEHILPDQGLQILEELLGKGTMREECQVMVFPVDWTGFIQSSYRVPPPFLEHLARGAKPRAAEPGLLGKLKKTPPQKRRLVLEDHIRAEVARVLGTASAGQIELRQRLFDLGLDSLMAMELKNRLEAGLGYPLRSTLIFDYPMIEALVDYLGKEILPQAIPTGTTAEKEGEVPVEQAAPVGEESLDALSAKELEQILERELEKQ